MSGADASPDSTVDLRAKLNRSKSILSLTSEEPDPASERSNLDVSVDIIADIPTPSPKSTLSIPLKEDLRSKISPSKDEALMETDDAED